MILQNYLNSLTSKDKAREVRRLSKALSVTSAYIYMLASGAKRTPEHLAVPLETATNGIVKREHTCPHLYR